MGLHVICTLSEIYCSLFLSIFRNICGNDVLQFTVQKSVSDKGRYMVDFISIPGGKSTDRNK